MFRLPDAGLENDTGEGVMGGTIAKACDGVDLTTMLRTIIITSDFAGCEPVCERGSIA